MTPKELLLYGAKEYGLEMTDLVADRFIWYLGLIEEKNEVMNLTAIRDPHQAVRLHFLDALAISANLNLSGRSVIDIGCELGIPGMALKLYDDTISLTLLDSLGKRIDFLREVCGLLGVTAECVHARAEEYVKEKRESFDVAVSRAVAELNILCELSLPYVRIGGIFCAMKASGSDEEIETAAGGIKTLGGTLLDVLSYEIPDTDVTHRLVIIEKIHSTDRRYPRQFAKIRRKPL